MRRINKDARVVVRSCSRHKPTIKGGNTISIMLRARNVKIIVPYLMELCKNGEFRCVGKANDAYAYAEESEYTKITRYMELPDSLENKTLSVAVYFNDGSMQIVVPKEFFV